MVSAGATDQLSGLGYDVAGNTTSDGVYSYAYNAENQQTPAAGVTYTYDGDGKRVKKSNGTLYWYGVGGEVLTETDLAGNNPTEYVFFAGKRVARRDPSGTVYYLFADHLGSSRVMTDSTGAVCYDADFYPYGGERAVTTTCPQNYKFTGKERDTEAQNDYFGARFHQSNLNRFMSPDPLMASAHARNPQTWNRYAYALNNPLRFVDPDGMEVPESGAKDKKCTIVVKINVIYDKTVNKGKGLTDAQKQQFRKDQIAKAQEAYANSNVKLDVTCTEGSFTVDNGKIYVSGLRSDALNLVATDGTTTGAVGESGVDKKSGVAISFINVNEAHSWNMWPLWTNSTEHELMHQFTGDVYKQWGAFSYSANEYVLDGRVEGQAAGVNQQGVREGLEPRRYAAPGNAEANKPQQ